MQPPVLTPREACRIRLDRHATRRRKLSWRLAKLIRIKRSSIYVLVGYAVFDPGAGLLLAPLTILLVPAVLIQNRIASEHHRSDLAVKFYRNTLARIDDQWVGQGDSGTRYFSKEHVFASDLDLFGHGSLFQFLCAARTSIGKQTLANWLTHPANAAEIHKRQAAVRELSENLDVRERLAVLKTPPGTHQRSTVSDWEQAQNPLPGRGRATTGVLLIMIATIAVVLWMQLSQEIWLFMAFILECGLFALCHRRLTDVSSSGHHAIKTQDFLTEVSLALRQTTFKSSRLSQIKNDINAGSLSHGRLLSLLHRYAVRFPPLLMLLYQAVPPVDRWRKTTAAKIRSGLEALGELEALASLARYSFEQPDTTFPTLVESETCYEASDLGHPLIPGNERVKNDMQLNESMRLLMISGSNMSGKSTMLRTAGINAVLAQCGGAVCAQQLRISPCCIGTAMRFEDSLEKKTSHFFSVISRLQAIMQLTSNKQPLLFLFDEILQGTNSNDRYAGAEAIIQTLIRCGAIGLVTTHDLKLTGIVDTLQSLARNVHFSDQIINGKIHFDHKMRPGIVQTTNALTLMRNIGLDI